MLKPEDISAIFEWIELLLIANLKRNLARHKDEEEQEGFTWTAWQAEKLRNLNIFRRQCSAIMDRYKDQIDDETRQLLEEQFEEGVNGAVRELEEAHAQTETPQLPTLQQEEQPSTEPETMTAPEPVTFQVRAAETQQKPTSEPETAAPEEPAPEITVETIIEDMAPEEPLVTVTVNPEPQFFGVDKAKTEKVIEDVTQLEEQAETAALRLTDDVYRQTVNRVQLAMATGSITYEKAVDMAVADFLNQGINCIEYKDGRRVNIADYVRMVLRTTSTRAALQGKSERFKASGYDTVLVSSYGMCSKTCLPWQGRVYINDAFMDWQGETKYEGDVKYGRSKYCGKWFPLLSSAIAEGLFHPNCRHSINLFIDGVTELPEPMDNSEIERRYKAEQAQRALEREVRKAKRKVEGSLDPADVKKAKDELREAQKNVRDHINKTNADEGTRVLVRKPLQEKIYGGDVRIGSDADPVYGPKSPPESVPEGYAVDVDVAASKQSVPAQYTGEKIPEKLKVAGSKGTVSEPEKAEGAYTEERIPENYIDKYPNSDIIETGNKNPEIPEEIINDVNEAVDKVAEDFPIIREQVEPIVFADTSPDLGENGLIPGKAINVIRLSDDYCSDYNKLRQKLAEDFESHFSYEADNAGSLACHELGHALHKILAMKRLGIQYGEDMDPLKDYLFGLECDKIMSELFVQSFDESFTSAEAIYAECEKQLGSMTRKPYEIIAQGIGNYYFGVTKMPISKAIFDYFKRELG